RRRRRRPPGRHPPRRLSAKKIGQGFSPVSFPRFAPCTRHFERSENFLSRREFCAEKSLFVFLLLRLCALCATSSVTSVLCSSLSANWQLVRLTASPILVTPRSRPPQTARDT